MKTLCAASVLCLTAMTAQTASATLIGDTVTVSMTGLGLSGNATASGVVAAGSGDVLTISDPNAFDIPFEFDFEASSVTISGSPNGFVVFGPQFFVMNDLDWVGMPDGVITGVNILSNNVGGIDSTDITFTEHSVTVSLNDSRWEVGDSLELSFLTDHGEPVIPEPATLSLLGLGLSGLGLLRRRRL